MRGTIPGNAIYFLRGRFDETFRAYPEFCPDFWDHCASMFRGDPERALKVLRDESGQDCGTDWLAWERWHAEVERRELEEYYASGDP